MLRSFREIQSPTLEQRGRTRFAPHSHTLLLTIRYSGPLAQTFAGTIWRNHLAEPSAVPRPLDRHSSSSPPSETFAGTICRPSSTGIAFNVQPALRPSHLVHNHKRPNAILHSYNVLNVIVGMHRLDDKDHPDVYLTTLPPSLPVIWVQ